MVTGANGPPKKFKNNYYVQFFTIYIHHSQLNFMHHKTNSMPTHKANALPRFCSSFATLAGVVRDGRREGKRRPRKMRSAGTADELASHVWVLLPPSPVLVLHCRPSPEPLFACFHDARGSEDAPFCLMQGVAGGVACIAKQAHMHSC
jgi:hypothetical protein